MKALIKWRNLIMIILFNFFLFLIFLAFLLFGFFILFFLVLRFTRRTFFTFFTFFLLFLLLFLLLLYTLAFFTFLFEKLFFLLFHILTKIIVIDMIFFVLKTVFSVLCFRMAVFSFRKSNRSIVVGFDNAFIIFVNFSIWIGVDDRIGDPKTAFFVSHIMRAKIIRIFMVSFSSIFLKMSIYLITNM